MNEFKKTLADMAKLTAQIEKQLRKDYNPKKWVEQYGKGPTIKDVASMMARKAFS